MNIVDVSGRMKLELEQKETPLVLAQFLNTSHTVQQLFMLSLKVAIVTSEPVTAELLIRTVPEQHRWLVKFFPARPQYGVEGYIGVSGDDEDFKFAILVDIHPTELRQALTRVYHIENVLHIEEPAE